MSPSRLGSATRACAASSAPVVTRYAPSTLAADSACRTHPDGPARKVKRAFASVDSSVVPAVVTAVTRASGNAPTRAW